MRRTPLQRRLRDELHALRPPQAAEAERRAWHVVRAAHAEQPPARRRARGARLALALAAAALLVALGLSPAGARVGNWIEDVVAPAPDRGGAGLDSLPARGRLLVVADGGPWVVRDDGSKRRLGGYRDATWSPGGLYVAASGGRELVALEPDGTVRWTRPGPGRVATPRWSPDGYRIAYRSGRDLFVAIADNSDGWLLARGVGAAAPAWLPRRAPEPQVVAYAAGRRVRIVEVDSRRVLGVTGAGLAPRELWWSDGRLIAVSSREVRVHGLRGRLLQRLALPARLGAGGSALDPAGRRLAVAGLRPDGRSSELLLYRLGRAARPQRLFAGPGPIEGLAWSIDGRVLTIGLPRADQWMFVRPRGGPFEVASEIRREFDGGTPARTGAFPRPAGWCYAKPPAAGAPSVPPCSAGAG